jgi:hypothetical protein
MNTFVSESPDSVVDAVLSASRVLVAVAARSLSDIAEEVTLTQYRSLVVLASRGPQNLVGLAEAVAVTPATATRMCDRLVKKTDRRRREIEVILSAIAPKEQTILVRALSRFAAAAGEVPEQDWSTGWDL